MNRSRIITTLALAIACAAAARAQNNPLTTSLKSDYVNVRNLVIRAADKMPEANYGFKPAPEVRTFGQQVAHVADDQYNLCSPVKVQTRQAAYSELENTLTSKADLVAAL